MTRMTHSSRLMATAALGAMLFGMAPAVSVSAKEQAAASAKADKPEIGDFGFDTTGMDKSVLPGNDFYAYANGTWAKNTAIPADKSNYGMFTALADLSQKRTQEILEAAKGDPNSMIGRAYASYLDSASVEAKGLAPIQPWLAKIRAVDKPGLAALLAEADRNGVSHFFGGYVGQDDKNPDVYIYTMFQGGLGMPDRDFYLKDNERNAKLQAAYLKHLENVLTLAGEQDAAARAQAIYAFEKQIATVHWDKNDSSDATKVYNKMTLAELEKAAPGFDWTTFVRGIGVKEDALLVSQPSAFTGEAKPRCSSAASTAFRTCCPMRSRRKPSPSMAPRCRERRRCRSAGSARSISRPAIWVKRSARIMSRNISRPKPRRKWTSWSRMSSRRSATASTILRGCSPKPR